MNKLEYIESLIAQGANSTEVFEKARQYDIDNPVKINDTQNQDATAVSTNANASNTESQSGNGSSASQPTINPGQVLSRNDGFEYKYEIDPNDPNQGIYFTRKEGSEDEWINANKDTSDEGNVAKASIANLFGHSSFDEKQRGQYFDNVAKRKELKQAKIEATKQYQRDNELGVLGILAEGFQGDTDDWWDWDGVRLFEGAARAIGETAEGILDVVDFTSSKFVVEPIAGALNYAGLMDLSDYEDDSWDGVNFDGLINNIITDYALGEGAEAGAYGDKFDFAEEVGDRIEGGMLDIASGLMAMPKLIADTKTMIGDTAGKILPQGAMDFLSHPLVQGTLFGPAGQVGLIFGQKDLVEYGETAYERFNKKSNQLNMTLMDFGEVGMTETLGKAFDGEATMEQRLGAFLTGGARITSSALGSLPSVAQSMIPYVGIASIVAGEAAKTNMESSKDGRPLDWARLGHAYVIGASEGLLELVTKKIGKGMFQGLRGGGKEVIQKSLLQYGTKVMKEFGQEGLSEVGTLLINQAADYVYKDEVENFLPAWGEVIDTFMIGGVMGGGMSAVGVGGQLLNSTIQSRNIKNSMKVSGDSSLSSMFDSINPFSEGGVSQEIARGAEDSTIAIERGPDGQPPTDSGVSGNPLVDAKNVKPENIDAVPKNEGVSETGFVDSKGNKESKTTNPLTSRENIDENNTANAPGKPTSKPKSTYTADERADAKHSIITNPQTEMFLNTELKRKVASGEITTTKAEEIKRNFKQQQGVANQIANLGYSGEARQKIIDLIPERNRLAQKVKDVGESSLTKPEQDRIAEIDAEIGSIPRTDTQQAQIDADVDADIAFTEKFGNIGKKDGEFKNFIGENKAVVTYNTTKEFMEATGVADGNVDAFITPEGQIIINKQHMREAGAIGVGRHELLHKILKSQFSGPNGENLKNDFLKILEQTDPAGYKLLMSRIKQKDANGERIYDDPYLEDNPDEYLTIYASLLAEGQIPLEAFVEKPSLVKRLGNFFSNIFSDAANENPVGPNVKPTDVGFKDGKDLYDFVRGYVKDSKSGVLSNRATELAEQGKDIKGTKAQSKTLTPLEAINDLIPAEIQTKEQFDKFMRSEKDAKAIADALQPGGVINNYIRSRETSREQGDKMIDEMYERIFNFNPEATRADGSKVGAEGFGESIFANTRFAKMVANKKLAEKSERQKQEKSIDSGTLQIADDTTVAKKDDTKVAKKPSETTGFDEATESRIDEAVNKSFKGDNVKFSETKNVPKEVANVYGEMFGINPQTITDKTRNYSKKDAEGLTKAKQFLLKNAKNDFARLPELKDDFGKGTFVPKNVKDALYTDGKLTGSLKEYIDLIREKPVKPIYRDRVGQTIRGLLNLAIRNRMLETAQPSQGKRLQSGAKFSKTITTEQNEILSKIGAARDKQQTREAAGIKNTVINNSNRVKMQKELQDAIDTGKISTETFDAARLANSGAKRSRLANGDVVYDLSNGQTIPGVLKESATGERLFDPPTAKQVEAFAGTGVTLVAENNRLYYGVKDPAYIKAKAATKPMSELKAIRVNVKNAFTETGQDQAKQNQDILYNVSKELEAAVKSKDISPEMMATIIEGAYQATTGLIKISYPFVGKSVKGEYALTGKPNQRTGQSKFREEHNPPASTTGGSLIYAIKQGIVDLVFPGIRKNTGQILLAKIDDRKIDIAKKDSTMDEGKTIMDNQITRITESDININTIIDPLTNQTFAEQNNVKVPKEFYFYPDVVSLQKKLVAEQQRSENPLSAKKAQARINVYVKSLAKLKNKASKTLTNQFSPKLSENATTEQKIETLGNYDKTLKFSRSLNTKPKGISVFDFDDTLARTKEKVIVTKANGEINEISAAQFAEQASNLESDGATFDFSNFDNVVNAKKGPLADLALKRQGKFGSKDIFVLTARPQIAATGIKAFLDGIGLNLPLDNITGLENGTPQAKANWVISKTAEGYNDFYFADDAIGNVKAVKNILDQVDVKSKVQQAKYSKSVTFDKIMNNIIEGKTGIKAEAEFSKARAQTVGAKKGRFTFLTTPSAEDFKGLLYRLLGKGKVGDAQSQFFKDNLYDPYNRAEQAVTRAKISAANDFKTLKNSLKTLPKSLSKLTGIGGFTFAQAARVAVWTRQGMEVPGLSKRDAKELNDFIDNNAELDVFVSELINIQKGKPYPKPGPNWLAGNITSDIVNEINKVNRKEYMQEFNENLDIILSEKVMNKLEAAYGPRYVEALRDQIRRMKSGSNRPVGNSRIVDQVLNWLNNSVGAIMFLNTRSAVLQTISAVNFINFGNNNLIAAGKALLNQKQYWKDFMTLMNSPYLVERRDGLKINVSESEIADAVSESSNKPKAFLNLLLSKGFVLTRIADSFAIAAGGSTFYRNQIKAYMKSGMDQAAAEKQAFDDFYAVAEESQQSSNPSKISQQQASGAGRVILAFANTPMQYARIIKRATQDLINGRGDWKTNVSKIVYYAAIQNLIFNALSAALFALAFGEEDEEEEDKTGRIANGMADSLLRGLGIQGAAVAAIKDALITIYEEANKEKGAPEFRKAIQDLFGFSPPLDAKIRKLNSGLNTLSWEREKMEQEGFNLNNPAYLAYAQVIAGLTNIPLDRAIQKINNLRAAVSNSSDKWQKVALLMGWSAWDLGLPYYGVEDKEVQTPQTILRDKVLKMKKDTSGAEQKQMLLDLGLTKQEIVKLKYEEIRIKKIIELQNKK